MLVLSRPNGITSFTRIAYPGLMPVSNHNNPLVLEARELHPTRIRPFFYSSCTGFKYGSHLFLFIARLSI